MTAFLMMAITEKKPEQQLLAALVVIPLALANKSLLGFSKVED
jgi:hypothetical protein